MLASMNFQHAQATTHSCLSIDLLFRYIDGGLVYNCVVMLMSIYLENRQKRESNFAKLYLALLKEKRNDNDHNFAMNFRKYIMHIVGEYIHFDISELRKMIDVLILVVSRENSDSCDEE
jgi:hypothetical protein